MFYFILERYEWMEVKKQVRFVKRRHKGEFTGSDDICGRIS